MVSPSCSRKPPSASPMVQQSLRYRAGTTRVPSAGNSLPGPIQLRYVESFLLKAPSALVSMRAVRDCEEAFLGILIIVSINGMSRACCKLRLDAGVGCSRCFGSE